MQKIKVEVVSTFRIARQMKENLREFLEGILRRIEVGESLTETPSKFWNGASYRFYAGRVQLCRKSRLHDVMLLWEDGEVLDLFDGHSPEMLRGRRLLIGVLSINK